MLGKLGDEEKPAYEVLEKYTGKDLEYKEYEPLYACAGEAAAKQKKKAHFVTCDTYVTMSDGTGIVHIAPAFGEDDSRIGRNYNLPFVQFVDGKGHLTKETPYADIFVKDADPKFWWIWTKKENSSKHRNSSMSIHTAGVVIHH